MRFNVKAYAAVSAFVLMILAFLTVDMYAYADDENVFSVCVPTALPIYASSDGTVTCADNLQIINNAASPIAVTDITVTAENGWELSDMNEDFSSMPLDSNRFALSFCGSTVPLSGCADLANIPALEGYETFTVFYDARVSPCSCPLEGEMIGSIVFTVGYETGRLRAIYLVKQPDKTLYLHGENFSSDGMVVAASYYGCEDAVIDGYVITDGEELGAERTSVTVSYTEEGITKSLSVPIQVRRQISAVEIISYPDKTVYSPNENFRSDGLAVRVRYSDGTDEVITAFTCSPATVSLGTAEVTAAFTAEGQDLSVQIPVSVVRTLSRIEITSPPYKTAYTALESFSPEGAVVTAYFVDGGSADVTGAVNWSKGILHEGDTSVSASYTYGAVTKSASVNVTVTNKVFSHLEIESLPSRQSYYIGQSFDPAGASVAAVFSNGERENVTDAVVWSHGILTDAVTEVRGTCSRYGDSASVSVPVTVIRNLCGIYVLNPPGKTVYSTGETFDKTGMTVMAQYEGGYECEAANVTSDYDSTPFCFVAPPSTVQIYVTTREYTLIPQLCMELGLNQSDFERWNNLAGHLYICPEGTAVYISDPALDESLTCTQNPVNVTVSYSENGNVRYCTVPVTVIRT